MSRRVGVSVALLFISATFVWLFVSRQPVPHIENGEQNAGTSTVFSEEGILVRNNPGLKPAVWYLSYEKPSAPGLLRELDFTHASSTGVAFTQGERVFVQGTERNGVVIVSTIVSATVHETGMSIKLYYYDPALDQGPGGVQCSSNGLVAVERVIPKSSTPLKDAVALLLRGELAEEERARGISTEFPLPGVVLQSASIKNGVATLTISDTSNKTSGGACRSSVLRAQVEATAKQFESVSSVVVKPDILFQP